MNKKTRVIIKIFMVACVLIMIYSIANIVMWYIGNKRNQAIKNEINGIINESINESIKESDISDKNDETRIDFSKLKEKNNEIIGYLKVNNTNIDYVVVKGNDNKFYLNHNLYKEYSRPGWIFMDYRDKLDGNDKNIIIYGHNTKDGSMFGSLRNVITKEWYENEDNHIINLVLENETLIYQVFSTYSISVEDYYIKTDFKNNSEFDTFVKKLKKRTVYDYNVEVTKEDSILTLSTCTGNGKSRMVLHAKLQGITKKN